MSQLNHDLPALVNYIEVDLLTARAEEAVHAHGCRPDNEDEADHEGHPQQGEVLRPPETHGYVVAREEVRSGVLLQFTCELHLRFNRLNE